MSEPIVTVAQGCLRGVEVNNIVGGSYLSFRGIPYAAPPVGDLRFRDPQPVESWDDVRDASTEGSVCAQLMPSKDYVEGSDDCLYLSVSTTSLEGSRAVMFWIHGGAFVCGSGSCESYRPDYLMKKDMVFVSINYRLGILGFLQLDDEVAPGNMGLKDQVAALRWVKENIAQFGGDPNNVTIFGQSAGAASVHYLLLSPLAKGLFHKAIMQSGSVLNPWAHSTTGASVAAAHRFVANLGKETTDPEEIVEYLRTIPVHDLIVAQENLLTREDKVNCMFPFLPSVDDKSPEPFLPLPLQEIAVKGFDLPVMIGYNNDEGILFLSGLPDGWYSEIDEKFEIAMPRGFVTIDTSEVSEIRKFYFGDSKITEALVDNYVQFYGDMYFVLGIHHAVDIQAKKDTPTFVYKFSHDNPNPFTNYLFGVDCKGTAHGAELEYLFYLAGYSFVKFERGSIEQTISKRFIKMWTNFAKTGNPTPEIDDLIPETWEPITGSAKHYMEITAELTPRVNPDEHIVEAWKNLYQLFADQ